ncbi:MAG: hypothetical protein M1822_006370 [Bathelium mastoideum]|nr:MAG: hypothetical protein M1822_006370 [Bathelium mastoideum]
MALPNEQNGPVAHAVNNKSDKSKAHKKRKRDPDGTSPKKKRRTENENSNSSQSSKASSKPLLYLETYSLWLCVSPISQLRALEGACAEYLSPLLLAYHQPFRGIVLSYENARFSQPSDVSAPESNAVLAKSCEEYAGNFVWLTANFVIFRPRKGSYIDGWVNIEAQSHLSLICWNLFNASIPRERLPKDWEWIADGQSHSSNDGKRSKKFHVGTGHFVDGAGKEISGQVRFRIENIEAARSSGKGRGFVSIQGTLSDD